MQFYTFDNYVEYVRENFDTEYTCSESRILYSLFSAQEYIFSIIDCSYCEYDCNCECDCSCCTQDVIEEAIYLYTYSNLERTKKQKSGTPFGDSPVGGNDFTTYRFLKNHGCINA